MAKETERERKTSIIQAAILGRVERLAGNGPESNPFPVGSEQWKSFKEGWSRSLDDPISNMLQQGRKAVREYAAAPSDGYA